MKINESEYKVDDNSILYYYEIKNDKPKLLLLHAQGTDSMSYKACLNKLSKYYHLYLVDCYGHGKSSHNKNKYNLMDIGNDLIKFIKNVIQSNVTVLGHSSGGLIAAYVASNSNSCNYLILEDPPLFSSCGDNRFNTFNYKDLSTVCHNYINNKEDIDFIYYYFINQYAWNFFPDESREKIRTKLGELALKYRNKYPDKNLKVPFWPKKAMEAFKGLNNYDPYFGESFYDDSFNKNINYEKLLAKIKCKTLFMKANTTISSDGLIQGALTDKDLEKVSSLISNLQIENFDCGHGIHIEKKKQFINMLIQQ